jgi:integrase
MNNKLPKGLYIPNDGKIIWASVGVPGQRRTIKESTGTTVIAEAEIYYLKLKLAVHEGTYVPKRLRSREEGRNPKGSITLERGLHRWALEKEKQSVYWSDLITAVLTALNPNTPVDHIGNAEMYSLKAFCSDRGNAPTTINKKLNLVYQMLNHAQKVWKISLPVFPDFDEIRIETRKAKKEFDFTLSHELEDDMLDFCLNQESTASKPWADYHDLMVVCIETGCRVGEVLQLNPNDVNIKGRRVHVRCWDDDQSTKTGVNRDVPMTDRCRDVFMNRNTHERPFASFKDTQHAYRLWQVIRDHFKLPVNKGADQKCFRRTCGTRLMGEARLSQKEVAEWLGHADVASTEHYLKIMPGVLDTVLDMVNNARPSI